MLRKRELRVRRVVVVAAAGVALVGAQAQITAPVKVQARMERVAVEQYRARVDALRGLAERCAASAAACDAGAVGGDERVTGGAEFEARWQWMRDAVGAAGKAKSADERAEMMRGAEARLDEMKADAAEPGAAGGGGFDAARKVAAEVLSRSEFKTVEEASWLDRKMARFWMWWYRLWSGVNVLGSGAPWLGAVLEWMFFGGAAVGLAWLLWRNLQRQRLAIALHESSAGLAWEREAKDWAADAESSAGEGRWRDAVHCLYWAAIVLLEGRRAWRHNPARTPREYVRLLEAGSAQQQSLRGLTQMLERVWYGLREAKQSDYERARGMFEALRGRPETLRGRHGERTA